MQLAARRDLLSGLVVGAALMVGAALLVVVLASRPAEAAFPGNNGKIAFASDRDGQTTNDLYSMRPNGTGVLRLTTTGLVEDSDWHPRGTRIAFSDQDINVARPDGTILATVNHPSNGAKDLSPAWSPDGRWIAFSGVRPLGGSDRDIYAVRPDGTGLKVLTNNTIQEGLNLDWSSSGKIVFSRGGDLYTMNGNNGLGQKLVTGDDNSTADSPEWSPDGGRIAYYRSAEIWTMNADGSGKALLSSEGLIADSPSWSPDGTKIAFQSRPISGDYEIYTVPANGGAVTQLTNNNFDDTAPAWQPIIP